MKWSDIPWQPPARTLRQFGLLCLLVFGSMAAWRFFGRHQVVSAGVLATLAVVGGLLGGLLPRALRPVFVGWMVLVFPIGWVVSKVVLCAAYFLVFTPVGLVQRLAGRDTLALRRRNCTTYWSEKRQPSDKRRYLAQY